MTVKYVASLNEVEQNAIEKAVRDMAQMLFLDMEETEEAVENALASKTDNLDGLCESVGVYDLKELFEKYA